MAGGELLLPGAPTVDTIFEHLMDATSNTITDRTGLVSGDEDVLGRLGQISAYYRLELLDPNQKDVVEHVAEEYGYDLSSF